MIGFIKAELFKTFRTKEYYYFLLLPIGLILFAAIEWLNRSNTQYISIASNYFYDKSPWHMYYGNCMILSPFIYTLLIIILVYFNISTECNKKTWKYLFALPNSDFGVFFSKQITCWLWVFLSLVLNFTVTSLVGLLLSYFNQEIPFTKFDNQLNVLLLLYVKYYLLLLPLVTIQIFLSILFEGKLLLFIVLPIFSWLSWFDFSPYNLAAKGLLKLTMFNGRKYIYGQNFSLLTQFELYSLIFIVVANALFFIYRYRIINKIV